MVEAALHAPAGSIRWARRAVAAAVLLGGVLICGIMALTPPDPTGMGTHERWGLPPCSMMERTGWPCPSCGMTTSFAHAVRGQWGAALRVQPAAALMAAAMFLIMGLAAWVLIGGRPLPQWIRRWLRPVMLWWVLAVLAAGWFYKIALVRGVF
jgi:hypothetical protein